MRVGARFRDDDDLLQVAVFDHTGERKLGPADHADVSAPCGNLRDELDDEGWTVRDLGHRPAGQAPAGKYFRQFSGYGQNLHPAGAGAVGRVLATAHGRHPGTQGFDPPGLVQARKIRHPRHFPNTSSMNDPSMRPGPAGVNWYG